jgi:PAS domain S-box-containing protein
VQRPSERTLTAALAIATIVAAGVVDQFSGQTLGLSNILLTLGVALAAWAGGWVGGLIALSVFPIALAFWPSVSLREWITGAVVLAAVALVRQRIEPLRRSEKKLRALLTSMNDIIVVFDRDGTYIEFVETSPWFVRQRAPEKLGHRIAEFFSPEEAKFFVGCIRTALDEQRTVETEYSLDTGGRTIWVSASISPLNATRVLWVARDITQRKQTEDDLHHANLELERRVEQRTRELKATELRYRSMVDQANDVVFTLTRDRRITSLNPAFTRVTGYRVSDWIGRDFVDLIAAEARPRAAELFVQALAKGSLENTVVLITHADGTAVTLEGSLINQIINGENVGFLGFARDVTARAKAEHELRRSEQHLADSQRVAKLGSWEFDLDSHALWWSDEKYRLVGLEPSDGPMTFARFLELVPEDERPRVEEANTMVVAHGEHEWELRIRTPDGVQKVLHSKAQLLTGRGGRRIFGTSQDVTEKRRAEQLLCESDERFRLIARATSDAIWDLDYLTGHVWRGDGYETLFGYAPGTLEANVDSFRQHVHPDDREQLHASFVEAIESGQPSFTHEFRFRRADGSYANILDRGYIVRDAEKRPVRVLGAMMDLTERQQMAEQLEQSKRLSSLGRLSASIAHEFNNVLMGVQANGEILGRRAPAELRHIVDNVTGAVRRGRRITEEILRFMRPSDPAPRALNVRRFLEQWADETRPLLRGRAQLAIGVAEDDLCIRADPEQIAQVFTNMAFNSRDAMPDGGGMLTIYAEAANSYSTFAFGVLRTPDRFVHFRVSDDGSGIAGEQLAHVFEPLYTTKRDGTGLGLAVSYQIVTRGGGHVFVESEVGRGTTFHVFLPLCCEERVAQPAVRAVSSSPLGRVLLVEDEPEVAAGVSMLLEAEGAEVYVVHTGGETPPAIERFMPDVVILDVGLPDINGFEVYEQIESRWPELRVLFSSGHAQAGSLERWLGRPNVALLVKPYEMSDLRGALSRLLETAAA